MAKLIQVSDDNEVTWYDIPGSTGEFSAETETADDTIFGQSFRSQEVGLISWMVSANAYYKGFAGYLADISEPGTPTAMTAEACSLVSGQIYQITAATKRVIDRSSTIVVDDNAVDQTANVEWIDYLFGRIKFLDSYTVTTPVTIDADYLPLTQLGKGNSFSLTMTADAIQTTDFGTAQGNSGHHTYTPGLRTVELELGGIFDATVNSKADLIARNELIITIDPAGDGLSIARGFFKPSTTSQAGDVGALEEETLNFTLTVPEDTPAVETPFSWVHDNTSTLSQSVQVLLTAWLDETEIDVQYLPSGAAGQSPLDGIKGGCIVTDVSLEGGLSDINTFAAEMQGTGAWTEV